jgi:spore germination protein GerM
MAGAHGRSPARRRGGGEARRTLGTWLMAVAALAAVAVLALRLLPSGPRPVEVFFVGYDATGRTGTVVPARRPAAPGGTAVRLRGALEALLAGPTADEERRGMRSEIPEGTALRGVRIERDVAAVDLTSAFARGGGSSSMLARVWQVVYTATDVRGVSAVQITLNGQRVQALGGEGVAIGAPLRRPAAVPTF